MNNQETKPEILNKLEDLINAVEDLLIKTTGSEESQFHIDLCKNKIIELYNLIALHEKALKTQTIIKNEPVFISDSHVSDNPDIEKHKRIETEEPITEISQQVETEPEVTESKEDTINETMPDDVTFEEIKIDSEETYKQTNEDIPTEKVSHSEKQTISDKFQTESGSLNHRFQNTQTDNSISSRLQANPVQDLRKAIGINDRFNFINELFDGDKGMYDLFLEKICSVNTSEEMLSVFNHETQQRKWNEKAAFNKMNDLIQRYAITK